MSQLSQVFYKLFYGETYYKSFVFTCDSCDRLSPLGLINVYYLFKNIFRVEVFTSYPAFVVKKDH